MKLSCVFFNISNFVNILLFTYPRGNLFGRRFLNIPNFFSVKMREILIFLPLINCIFFEINLNEKRCFVDDVPADSQMVWIRDIVRIARKLWPKIDFLSKKLNFGQNYNFLQNLVKF